MTAPTPLIAGNWKMNGVAASIDEARAVAAAVAGQAVRVAICPPTTLIQRMSDALAGTAVIVGAQDCHCDESGAFTGDVSAEMLADAGATAVIVGHSERRTYHGESDGMVRAKALAAGRAGLMAIVCVGETRDQRTSGRTLDVVGGQLAGSLPNAVVPEGVVIAYEPVWAIGTGLTPTSQDVAEMHKTIRALLGELLGAAGPKTRILYGGSVKPGNAKELLGLPNVDGALVGGASLKAADFLGIAAAYR
jgi:triosephosphate isomerase (TIM)